MSPRPALLALALAVVAAGCGRGPRVGEVYVDRLLEAATGEERITSRVVVEGVAAGEVVVQRAGWTEGEVERVPAAVFGRRYRRAE
jgi:hypothetical protein